MNLGNIDLSPIINRYRKKMIRSLFAINPFIRLVRIRARKKNIYNIKAILTAEINSFKLLSEDQKVHIAIKILKVTDQW